MAGVQNCYDIKNNKFIRESDEFLMTIDFNNQQFDYTLKKENINVFDKIQASFQKINNDYILKYTISSEEMKILIHLL